MHCAHTCCTCLCTAARVSLHFGNCTAVARQLYLCTDAHLYLSVPQVLKNLSEGHCAAFGIPTPTEVSLVPRPGKCILVTGHDMHDLHALLLQTEGKGVDVYTHGEMLPAHGYPGGAGGGVCVEGGGTLTV